MTTTANKVRARRRLVVIAVAAVASALTWIPAPAATVVGLLGLLVLSYAAAGYVNEPELVDKANKLRQYHEAAIAAYHRLNARTHAVEAAYKALLDHPSTRGGDNGL